MPYRALAYSSVPVSVPEGPERSARLFYYESQITHPRMNEQKVSLKT